MVARVEVPLVEPVCYRPSEKEGVINTLRSGSQLLVTSQEGMGKTFLLQTVYRDLIGEGWKVGIFEPQSPKLILVAIAELLGVSAKNLEGRGLTVEGLKVNLAQALSVKTGVCLMFDDSHLLEPKFRLWLKQLKAMGVPLLLAATNPPRADIFVYLPRVELQPIADYQIRDLMEKTALEMGADLKPYQFSRLQSTAGGNPMLAKRAIEEGFLGIQNEAGDHGRYFDMTPLLLLVGIIFVAYRFIGMGTGNQSLYIMSGILGAVFLGLARLSFYLPKESRRIG